VLTTAAFSDSAFFSIGFSNAVVFVESCAFAGVTAYKKINKKRRISNRIINASSFVIKLDR